MTIDEALAVFEGNPTDFSRPTKILDAGYALAAEVRRLRALVRDAFREGANGREDYDAALAWQMSDAKSALEGR